LSWQRMALRDFVIVRELELDLNQGFTVLTGETGAGKSILIDALHHWTFDEHIDDSAEDDEDFDDDTSDDDAPSDEFPPN